MANDYTVRTISVTHVPQLDNQNRYISVTRVRIVVGTYGEFTKDFPPGADSAEAVNGWKVERQQYVMSIAG